MVAPRRTIDDRVDAVNGSMVDGQKSMVAGLSWSPHDGPSTMDSRPWAIDRRRKDFEIDRDAQEFTVARLSWSTTD
jgi:hypothetical protein